MLSRLAVQDTNMEARRAVVIFLLSVVFIILGTGFSIGVASEDTESKSDRQNVQVDDKKLDYAKGSICSYCDYCKVWFSLAWCIFLILKSYKF